MIGAAITGDYAPLYDIPKEIGQLKFYIKSWFPGGSETGWKDIELRMCTENDFSSVDYQSEAPAPFFETVNTASDLAIYGLSMRCAKNSEDLQIWGNYASGNAGSLVIVFEKCNRGTETGCASEDDIT